MQKLKPSFVLRSFSVTNKSPGKQKSNQKKLQGYAQNSPPKKLPLPTVTVSITTTTSNSTVSTSSLTYNQHHHHHHHHQKRKNTPDDINQSSKTMSSLLCRRRCLSVHFTAASFPSSLSFFHSFSLSLCVSSLSSCVCSV